MLNIINVKDLGSDWSGFAKIWGGDEGSTYFYWSYYVRDNNSSEYLLSCNQYDTGYIEWEISPAEGFDWEAFRKEVKEALDIELPEK